MMKKITFLCILLVTSFGYSQALPFDFSNANQLFSAGGSTPTLVTDPDDAGNTVMQIDGGAGAWDNVKFTFAAPVDLSNNATNNITFRIKPTQDYGVRNHLLKFEAPGEAEVPFSTAAGTDWQEISLDFGPGKGSYSDMFFFMDAGATSQGVYLIDDISAPEAAPETCSDGIMNQDETFIDCGGSCAPCSPKPFSNYCSTQVFHLNIPAQVDSAINLTIVNTGGNSMKITAAATDITVLNFVGTIAGSPTVSAADASVSGEISRTLTWDGAPPTNLTIQFLQWKKSSTEPATWQIENVTTPFAGVCPEPNEITTLSDLKLDGVTITGFGAAKTTYDIAVNAGDAIPQITSATPTNPLATVGVFTQATALPGTATFDVTSENTMVVQTYTINYVFVAPQVAAPTPPARLASDVVSIFSDAYPTSAIDPINYDAGWCNNNNPGAVTATTADGNAIFAYNDKDCQGMVFSGDLQNLTGFTHIHIDLFIKDGTNLVGKIFNMFTVPSTGANSPFNIDINGLNPAPVPGTWYSYDVPITFSGPTVDIKEFGVVTNLKNEVWYDNLYFHKNTTLSNESFVIDGLKIYPNPTQDTWNINTNNVTMQSIQVFDVLGKNVISLSPNASEAVIEGSSLKSGLYFARIQTALGTSSLKLVKK
jgi:hypothetical protein